MFLSLFNDLRVSLSSFEMFVFGGFEFSSACLTLHFCSSVLTVGIFKAASSVGAIKSM